MLNKLSLVHSRHDQSLIIMLCEVPQLKYNSHIKIKNKQRKTFKINSNILILD